MGIESFFLRPDTVERIRASLVGPAIERYVEWLEQHQYSPRNVWRRVPALMHFGRFAQARGAKCVTDLPMHVDAFVARWAAQRRNLKRSRSSYELESRNPIEQMLRLVVPGFEPYRHRHLPEPFAKQAPGYLEYLRRERGLSKLTSRGYGIQLRFFEDYLRKVGIRRLRDLSPAVLSSFVVARSHRLGKKALRVACSAVKGFLRYVHAQGLVCRDLASAVESPRTYRFAELPRSIAWEEVQRVLAVADRRTAVGKRDYAILLLLVTYGLRAQEVAALRLHDINWRCNHLQLVGRKAGHSTAYPLSREVGEAILDYLRQGRPPTSERQLFIAAVAPRGPMTFRSVAERARHYLRKAGVSIIRPGSHTMRHTCVQRLVNSNFSLKEIGDYVGHGVPESTQIYAKVDLQHLREVGCSDVESIL